jgi:CubicO group peptidase (beta-lactamase class C family)
MKQRLSPFSGSSFSLEETVREARARTGVPGVAAGLSIGGRTSFAADGVLALGSRERVRTGTPFRIASISKSFTATLAADTLPLDDGVRARLTHTAGLRCESAQPLPDGAGGLWSYSNAGYWAVGDAVAVAAGVPFSEAMRSAVLAPLGLGSTGFDEPRRPARGHVQHGKTGHRAVLVDAYPLERRPSGGLWSTTADLVLYGRHHLDERPALHEPAAAALGGRYALGWWARPLADGTLALDHEGSVAGYQSLLLLVPERELVLAVLTNSWRGSGLVRRLVEKLGLLPAERAHDPVDPSVAGRYAIDDVEARVEVSGASLSVSVDEPDAVTGARSTTTVAARPLGCGVYGFARGRLMSHRLDFPRAGVARIGWIAMPRVQ